MKLARQQRLDIRAGDSSLLAHHDSAARSRPSAPMAFSEPQEREDTRNVLLDTAARQIVDLVECAARNDVLELLLRRLDAAVPDIARRLAPVVTPPAGAPAGMAPAFERVDLARVLTPLQLSDKFRMSPEHRAMFATARTIVLGWLQQVRPAHSHTPAAQPSALPATIGIWEDDAGGGA